MDILTQPAWDCLPYDRASPGADIVARRCNVFRADARDIIARFEQRYRDLFDGTETLFDYLPATSPHSPQTRPRISPPSRRPAAE